MIKTLNCQTWYYWFHQFQCPWREFLWMTSLIPKDKKTTWSNGDPICTRNLTLSFLQCLFLTTKCWKRYYTCILSKLCKVSLRCILQVICMCTTKYSILFCICILKKQSTLECKFHSFFIVSWMYLTMQDSAYKWHLFYPCWY